MVHNQFINFLEATVIALTLANAFAVIVAATGGHLGRYACSSLGAARGRSAREPTMQVLPQRVAHSAVATTGEL